MTLPLRLQSIYNYNQRSYKMVLMLVLIDELKGNPRQQVSFQTIKSRFLSFFQKREALKQKVDPIPKYLHKQRWNDVTLQDINGIIQTPVDALQSQAVIQYDKSADTIQFQPDIVEQLTPEIFVELREKTLSELNNYFTRLSNDFSLRAAFIRFMELYTTARNEAFKGHPIGQLMRQEIPGQLQKLPFMYEKLKVQGSVGQGNWAKNPWLAILDTRITTTTQNGEYIVYLFSEDLKTVYLTLAQGVTVPIREMGRTRAYQYLQEKADAIRRQLSLTGMKQDDQIYLSSEGLGRDYQVSTIAYYRYDLDRMPDDQQLLADLENVVINYKKYVESKLNEEDEQIIENDVDELPQPASFPIITDEEVKPTIEHIKAYIAQRGFTYPEHLIENFYLSLKTKPFVILAGVSGTGKTKLVELFAEALGATKHNQRYTLIPVRPDWSDPSDLIGYTDLSGKFRPGKLTEIVEIASRPERQQESFFICLDEMNLARVEHYFSDLLSLLETQKWDEGKIRTQHLLSEQIFTSEEDKEKYARLHVPDNVYLIGTVNMDETTHPFSKKVLDRANTIEFNYINLNQFPDHGADEDVGFVTVHHQFLRSDYLQLVHAYEQYEDLIKATTEKLVEVNRILESIHAHVGFRIRDAVCFYMIYNDRFQLMSEDEAFDLQLLQKILPRIQGSHLAVKKVLLQLLQLCLNENFSMNDMLDDASELYSRWDVGETPPDAKYPRSARKLAFMLRRYDEDGFTSYWLS